jgi:16S rRNA (adenine1518-N6/adenine1519-N6)-dimethyltransferase
VRREQRDWSTWKLVSNLPYSIASPLLVEFAQMPQPPARITVTLQEEVAERLIAAPGNKTFGVLSLLIQVRYQASDSFRIPRSCFFPAPDVDSACITLARRDARPLSMTELAAFTGLVKLAFSQRRKMMLKLLKTKWPADLLEPAFKKLDLSPQVRAEDLSLERFLDLTRILQNHG